MMKNAVKNGFLLLLLMIGVFCAPVTGSANEDPDMIPVYGEEIQDGSYAVEVESSSSMFRVVKAELQVADGQMKAELTLSGTGYLKLFMGTGEEALTTGEDSYIPYVEDEEGAYTYTIPVEALDQEFDCAAYSKRKQKWYDRILVILADSLPEGALKHPAASKAGEGAEDISGSGGVETEEGLSDTNPVSRPARTEEAEIPARIQAGDGDYTMEVTLEGGTGKAGVSSPVRLRIADGRATAVLEWSSPSYDYMDIGGTRYYPVNTDGNSVFEIPVTALDEAVDVTADTTAMSRPHEIDYRLTFHSDTLQREAADHTAVILVSSAALAAVAVVAAALVRRKKKVRDA